MGKATVLAVGTREVTVRVEIDDALLISELLTVNESISTLTTSISTSELIVIEKEEDANQANENLTNAIETEQERDVIIKLQLELIISIDSLVNEKKLLSTLKYKRLSSEKRKLRLNEELTPRNPIVISTADSGVSILVGQQIGVIETSRITDKGANYIATPSERLGVGVSPHLHQPQRDGISLPKISEESRGWWYNTLVLSATQIFRPRYWAAILLDKDNDTGLGTIFIVHSKDENKVPFNQAKLVYFDVESIEA